jgi:hypothetical protein
MAQQRTEDLQLKVNVMQLYKFPRYIADGQF